MATKALIPLYFLALAHLQPVSPLLSSSHGAVSSLHERWHQLARPLSLRLRGGLESPGFSSFSAGMNGGTGLDDMFDTGPGAAAKPPPGFEVSLCCAQMTHQPQEYGV